MARKSPAKSPLAKPMKWALFGQAAFVLRDHWQQIPAADRARLTELLGASKGRPSNLTPKQREELTAIVKSLDLRALTRDLAPIATKNVAVNRAAKGGRFGKKL